MLIQRVKVKCLQYSACSKNVLYLPATPFLTKPKESLYELEVRVNMFASIFYLFYNKTVVGLFKNHPYLGLQNSDS